ncbi:hypothetical protein MASR1M8_00240 [Thermomonas brevis]
MWAAALAPMGLKAVVIPAINANRVNQALIKKLADCHPETAIFAGGRVKIEASWSKPIPLKKDPKDQLIYILNLADLPDEPGVYVFGRKHGSTVAPIYIGETLSIRGRIKSHLESLPLVIPPPIS